METKGYYSIIRFVPDAFREEAVNLGVLLLCPERQFFDWRLTSNHQRARRFFKYEADVERLRVLGRGLAKRLEAQRADLLDPKRLADFIARHHGMLQMTALRTCAVSDPPAELSRLFARLVDQETPPVAARGMNAQQVRSFATSRFQQAGVWDKLDKDVEFPARYRPAAYQFAFGYQNGGPYKLIHTSSFVYKDANEACERALVLLGEIDDVRTHQNGRGLDFQVIAAFDDEQPAVREAVSTAFREKEVRLWVPREIDPLIEQVKAEIH